MGDVDRGRFELVRGRARAWAAELVELNHRNTLVNFKRPKTASLDLTGSAPQALRQLLADGRKVALRALFPDEPEHRDACARARHLHRKTIAFREEQGIEVGRIAHGLVRLAAPGPADRRGSTPLCAPLLLRPLSISPKTVAESDYTLEAGPDAELNPVLAHALNREHGLGLDPEQADNLLMKINTSISELAEPSDQLDRAFACLTELAERERIQLELERAVVVGLFNYQKLPMVRDLESATELLADHDLVAALAGSPQAEHAVQTCSSGYAPPPIDSIKPEHEFLAQDADSSQQQAIETALAGHHLIIEGPPGTGKSQTIANIIVGAAAHGKSVLFVAEKRAAIEAVTDRLADAGLPDLVLDLHSSMRNKKQVATQLSDSLTRLSQQPPVDATETQREFADRRDWLTTYSHELHLTREPWGLSAYQVWVGLLALGKAYRTDFAIRGDDLRRLDKPTAEAVEEDLKKFVELGGLRILRRESPWWRAEVTEAERAEVLAQLDELTGRTLRDAEQRMHRLLAGVGLPVPREIGGWRRMLELLDRVAISVDTFGPDVFGDELDLLRHATARRAERKQGPLRTTWRQRRALVKRARARCTSGLTRRPELHAALNEVAAHRDRWRELAGPGAVPTPAAELAEVATSYQTLRTQLAAVALSARLEDVESRPTPEVAGELDALRADRDMLDRLPEINRLRAGFERLGLSQLLADLVHHDRTAEAAGLMFRHTWLRCLADEFRLASRHLSHFTPDRHDRLVQEFQQADRRHRDATAQRARRAVAVAVRKARDAHPEQARTLTREAAKSRRLMPLRKLVEQTADVLLTVRPCWAMSPLVVSQTLPAARLFDLVIFDEASQIKPHDAVTSIMRGHRLVVAGDEHQLPPSTFFDKQFAGDDQQDDEDEYDLGDYESILNSLRSVIPNRRLLWHYRSQDERLIAFSNQEIYDGDLVTFPGARRENPLRLEVVPGTASPGQGGLPVEELHRVVELVIEHAERRPEQSLGVITLGAKHQDRVERAIQEALRERRDLDGFFADEVGLTRRFFVKNIETVQGDERDAIILSVGVAPGADGTVDRRTFGALNQEVGVRRLNVAVTRARQTLTVVSSFPPGALAPWPTRNGTELLRRFLEMAERDVDPTEVGHSSGAELNGLERDIHHTLTNAGITVFPQWGVSKYVIDFALAHPKRPGQMVLALEADGDRYHRSASARDRDRLRQEHLERLGWQFHRVWASAWFTNPGRQTQKIVEVWRRAVAEFDAAQARPRPPRPPRTPRPAAAAPAALRGFDRGPRPNVPPGLKITQYTERQLVELCHWLMRDGLALDAQERLTQAMHELGLLHRGKVIVERLTNAIRIAQHHIDRGEP